MIAKLPRWGTLATPAVVVCFLWMQALPALAQTANERIVGYEIEMEVEEPNGELLVREVINYDFGTNHKHGIIREIPVRQTYDDKFDRVYPLEVISVVGSPVTPAEYELSRSSGNQVIRIGDPDRTITGRHRYEITYRVSGVLNAFSEHDELYWNVIGSNWPVPIDNVSARLSAPAQILKVACLAGPTRSVLPCDSAQVEGSRASFSHSSLAPRQALTVVVSIPKGAVDAPTPVLEERWSLARAFAVTPSTVAGSLTILGLLVGLLAQQVWKRGRDRKFAGSHVDAAYGTGGEEELVGLAERPIIPVQFLPPKDLRPGVMGTLIDETAHPLDVIATIVDLAVRGYLKIEEAPSEGWFAKPNWLLTKLKEGDDLQEYERKLFDSLFRSGEVVAISDLKDKFASRLQKVQEELYRDVVRRGWFNMRPDHVRATWVGIGVAILLLGIGLVVATAAYTTLGLLALPFPVTGLLVLIGANKMPARTAKGTAMLRRVKGFERFIEESEADRARFAEQKNLFSEYLPYAIVFGCTEKWAKAFEGLDGELPETAWYVGHHPFTAFGFSQAMDGFTVNTAGTITSTPAASGSSGFGGGGFSGGGAGGGGGGSW
ncbi:MAG: DUF2207 domain-containing protein [Actinomycetota bacterium]